MWRSEKNGSGGKDLVWSGMERGIATSPIDGTANLQNVNLQTEPKEVMCSFGRLQQSQPNSLATGTFLAATSSGITVQGGWAGGLLRAGMWVTTGTSTITGISSSTNYYVIQNTNATGGVSLAATYNGAGLTGLGTTGSCTFNLLRNVGQPIAKATETYSDGTNIQYRYYILDANGLVWVYDTATVSSMYNLSWFLPDYSISYYGSSTPSGMAVMEGWLHVFSGNTIWCKPTVNLGNTTANSTTFASFASGLMLSTLNSTNPHFAFYGHQDKMYYTDGNYIGSITPSIQLASGTPNIHSYASFTAVTSTGTIAALISGSLPTYGGTSSLRIPALFFPSAGGSNATATTAGTIYWIQYSLGAGIAGTFKVYAAQSGGAALDLATGASGTQYFNTYSPTTTGGETTITFSPTNLSLPPFEVATSVAEAGSTLIIGTKSNSIYPWNQVDPFPGDLIPIPENNTQYLLTVNNTVYIFAGNKGNIYVTNGSLASAVMTIPDYCAGVPGTPSTYVEPVFVWGDAMYLRGRVYFSVLDQTSAKAGNCGGIWSFIPTNNYFVQQDTGLALRMEAQNSYGSYNGVATVLLANAQQNAIGPQYWSGWYSSVSNPLYGIDVQAAMPTSNAVIETDLAATGTMLDKHTFSRIEYKVSSPLLSGESVAIQYRLNSTDAWSSFATTLVTDTPLSGYYSSSFQLSQWLQLQATLTPNGGSGYSGNRITELRVVT